MERRAIAPRKGGRASRAGRRAWRTERVPLSQVVLRSPLLEGMTVGEAARALLACAAAMAVGSLALNAFGWALGHFAKGWW